MAAIFYTIGVAYGYRGFGDIAVFIFFGPAAVLGSQLLVLGASGQVVDFFPDSVYLGVAVGIHSVMVLHVSAMRDIDEDRLSGKKTIASRLGHRFSAVYLAILYVISACCSLTACLTSHKFWECIIVGVALVPLAASCYRSFSHCLDSKKIASERKFCLIGCAIHNVSWIIVLILESISTCSDSFSVVAFSIASCLLLKISLNSLSCSSYISPNKLNGSLNLL